MPSDKEQAVDSLAFRLSQSLPWPEAANLRFLIPETKSVANIPGSDVRFDGPIKFNAGNSPEMLRGQQELLAQRALRSGLGEERAEEIRREQPKDLDLRTLAFGLAQNDPDERGLTVRAKPPLSNEQAEATAVTGDVRNRAMDFVREMLGR